MVTLVGVGGVGKTALAVEAAWAEVSAGRAELACYVDLVPCHTDDQVIAALVEGVGIRGAPAAGLDAVVDAVSGGRSLLVIDNCEHVLESVRRACDRLAERVPGLRLLVTSRIPLDVEPECVRRVPPMAVPDEAGPPVVTEAVTLFFARAAMAGATLQDGPAELALASSICRQAAGLPLAIELVANRLRVASLTELASGLGLSQWPARSAGQGRHDSLDACLTWSHALLPADAAVVFRRLSVFPGGFDLAAAQEVAGTQPVKGSQVGALVEQLVTASLLEADTSGTKTRFRFNEPVRQYAAARLAAAGEADLARRRHARAFLARAEVVEPMLFAPQAEQHCDLLEFDRPDHDAAMDWLLASGAAEEAQRLAAALYFFWYTRGLFVTGLRWLRAALSAEGQVEPMVRLRAEVGLAQLAFIAGDYRASFTAIESAVPTARLLGDDVVLARCLATAGYVWWLLDPERSAELFEEGLEAAHRGGDGWTRSTGLAGLGWARYFAGTFDVALDSLGEAIQLTARSGRRQQFAMAILGRAAVELSRGQLAAADGSAQQALGVLRAIGDASWTSAALAVGAEIERARGRLEEAGRHAAEAIEVARRANSAINVMIGTGHLGRILLAGGGPGAGDYLDQAVQLARAFAVRPLVAWWLDSLGELAELEGRYDDARSWYEQAAGHAAECGLPVDAARARHHRARLAWLQGDQASHLGRARRRRLRPRCDVIPHPADVLPARTPHAGSMPNAILNGISIDYTTAGEGPPVLLICGTGQPADLWFAQVADLVAAGHRVITFDNRGCGRSAAPPAPYRVADMAADTAALIEHLGLGPCDVIGYSLGGYIAQQLAVTCLALVRRLVLVAGVGAAPAYALARARAAVDLALDPLPSSFDVADLLLSLHSMPQLQNDDDAVKVTISLIEAGGPWTNPGRLGQYQADLDWLQDSSHLDRLSHITSPCLAMAFEHDCWFPPRVVREAAQRMAGCQYVELSGLGHGAPLLAPGEVNPVIAKFLA